ncbi:MAG: hypothetical protein D3904_12835, partial [Candidatus Electrothrix sp. EH2]|nr:hypothetical protein [Candidatus Electrothrix sp. EH2]
LRMEIGRSLVTKKCKICHNLERIFGTRKSPQEWQETVSRMQETSGDDDFFSQQEVEDIIYFLTHIRKRPDDDPKDTGDTSDQQEIEKLIRAKCSAGCHALDRVLRVKKSEQEWLETVNSMMEISGDPNFLTPQQKKDIARFLSKHTQGARLGEFHPNPDIHPLLDNKCNVCHDLGRIQRVERKKEEWEDIVNSMVESTGDPDYLSKQEKEKIINIISTWGAQGKEKQE